MSLLKVRVREHENTMRGTKCNPPSIENRFFHTILGIPPTNVGFYKIGVNWYGVSSNMLIFYSKVRVSCLLCDINKFYEYKQVYLGKHRGK